MKTSTYIFNLVVHMLLLSSYYRASEMKDGKSKPDLLCFSKMLKRNKKDRYDSISQPLNKKIFEKKSEFDEVIMKDKKMTATVRHLVKKAVLNPIDERANIDMLLLKIQDYKREVDITQYVVKVYSSYVIGNKKIKQKGTATIIGIEKGAIYLLTCAHNLVNHINLDPFNPASSYAFYYPNSIFFSQKMGKKYLCKNYYIHPEYNGKGRKKDIAILISHRGYDLQFPYSFFPKIEPITSKKCKGGIIGFPGEEEKSDDIYGMLGELSVTDDFFEYDKIDTSNGQSGAGIWSKIGSSHKIIGVHAGGSIFSNYGICINKDIANWIYLCWLYERQGSVL